MNPKPRPSKTSTFTRHIRRCSHKTKKDKKVTLTPIAISMGQNYPLLKLWCELMDIYERKKIPFDAFWNVMQLYPLEWQIKSLQMLKK